MRWIRFPKNHYVYELAIDRVVRYVGKGRNSRVFSNELRLKNRCTEYRIVKDDLNMREALQLERRRIAMYPEGQLWNRVTHGAHWLRQVKRAVKVRWAKPGARERHGLAIKRKWEDPNYKARVRRTMQKAADERWSELGYREKISDATKKSWRSKEYRQKWLATRKARGPTRGRVAIV